MKIGVWSLPLSSSQFGEENEQNTSPLAEEEDRQHVWSKEA